MRMPKYVSLFVLSLGFIACGPISPSAPKFAKAITNSSSSSKDLGDRVALGVATETSSKKPSTLADAKQTTSFDEIEEFLKKFKKVGKKAYFELDVESLGDFLKNGSAAFATSDLIRSNDIANKELERIKEDVEIHLLLENSDKSAGSIEQLKKASPTIQVELAYQKLPSGGYTWLLTFDKDILNEDLAHIRSHTQGIIVIFNPKN